MKALKATGGPLTGQSYQISGMMLIGREGDCDIQVLDTGVSRKHACLLEQDDGTILLRDLASQNGTLVKNERVTEKLLSEGDTFSIGKSVFLFTEKASGAFTTDSVDIKLMSGPAVQETTTEHLTPEQRNQLMQARKLAQAAAFSAQGAKGICCGSPLAGKARAEGWAHCPACGASL